MLFLLFLLDDRRIRIREAQKHMDPMDPYPQHCYEGRPNYKRSFQPLKRTYSTALQNMKSLHFFRLLGLFALLVLDPDL
jgi:hypothetical protein